MQWLIKVVAAPVLAALFFVVPSTAHAAKPNAFTGIPVSSSDGAFTGTMDVLGFQNEGCAVSAIASISGTLHQGGAAQQVSNVIALVPVQLPEAFATACNSGSGSSSSELRGFGGSSALVTPRFSPAQAAACPILDLTLGPLDLNLLGLTVHLNQVVLNIAAQPGNGNLLGNLLCAVANLLNGLNLNILGTALANALVTLLNNLLTGLGL
jgi:hypothetical protein